jgi:hypothetical protein
MGMRINHHPPATLRHKAEKVFHEVVDRLAQDRQSRDSSSPAEPRSFAGIGARDYPARLSSSRDALGEVVLGESNTK